MNPYETCSRCARYVKRAERACPFCGAAREAAGAHAPAPQRPRRSRAQWLAYGSTLALAAGCTDGLVTVVLAGKPDATTPSEASVDPAEPGVSPVSEVSGSGPSDAGLFCEAGPQWAAMRAAQSGPGSSTGTFNAAVICDPATQYCATDSVGDPYCGSLATRAGLSDGSIQVCVLAPYMTRTWNANVVDGGNFVYTTVNTDLNCNLALGQQCSTDVWGNRLCATYPGDLTPGDGGFVCLRAPYWLLVDASAGDRQEVDADLVCDRATQYCAIDHDSPQCLPLANTCAVASDAGCRSNATLELNWGACEAGSLSRCACMTTNCKGDSCGSCSDDEAGGLTAICSYCACYGSPPSRLERLQNQPVA